MTACALELPIRLRHMRSTVCVIDDDQEMREILARVVRSVGLEPELYDSAAAFLRRAGRSPVGCLLLDVQLGGMSGLELLEQLSDEQVIFPVFMISSAHDADTLAQARRLGAIVIDKPFDVRALALRILASVGEDRDGPAS
jgi:FixJ family two-component response regulator